MADKRNKDKGTRTITGSHGNGDGNGNGNLHAENAYQEDTFDIGRFLHVLYIHKWKFIIILLLVMILAYLYAVRQPVFYQSKYEVFYSETAKEYVSKSEVPVIKPEFDRTFWQSVMLSDEAARLTLENSNLPYTIPIIKRMIKVEMKASRDRTSGPPIYEVTITSKRNELIPVLMNSFIKALNDLLYKYQLENSEKLVEFLSKQLTDNNKKLAEIDRKILHEQSSNPYLIRDISKLSTDLESFRTELTNTQINLSSIRAAKKQTEQELQNQDGIIMTETSFSEPLKVQLMNLQVDLARALTQNKEDHPKVKAIRDNIVQITSMLRDSIEQKLEIQNLSSNPLKDQLMSKLLDFQINEISLETKQQYLRSAIAELENQMLPDTTNVNQQQLIRSREMILMSMNMLNSKIIEVHSAALGNLNRFVLIDEPVVPMAPANKGMHYYLLIGLMLGLLLGGGSVFIYDMIDNRIMLLTDYEKFYHYPVLGGLLHKANADQFKLEAESKTESYGYKSETSEIIINIRQHLKRSDQKLIALCSPVRQEGKSLVIMQLAKGLADKKLNVLLVDLDVFAPKLTYKMEKADNAGLMNFINDELPIGDIVTTTAIPNLKFVPAGRYEHPVEFNFDDNMFIKFIKWAKTNFDVVLFDTPALLYIPEVLNFMELTDMIVPVVRLRHTNRNSLDKLFKLLEPNRSKIIGAAINDIKTNALTKYSNYYGSYYKYYAYKPLPEQNKDRKTRFQEMRQKLSGSSTPPVSKRKFEKPDVS